MTSKERGLGLLNSKILFALGENYLVFASVHRLKETYIFDS